MPGFVVLTINQFNTCFKNTALLSNKEGCKTKHLQPSFKVKLLYSVPGFTKPSFASRLNVACGTARRRALSINLPVMRQMP